MDIDDPTSETVAGFQESWWIGLAGLVVSIPFVIYFWKHYVRDTDWQVPYLTEPDDCEKDTTE